MYEISSRYRVIQEKLQISNMGADMNAVRDFKKKAVPEQIENFRKLYESSSSEGKQELIDLNKPQCDECKFLCISNLF